MLEGCAICYACEFLDLLPDLVVRGLAIYFFLYLQTLYVIAQRVVDPLFQFLERNPIQYRMCIAYLKDWLDSAIVLAPGTKVVVLNVLYNAGLDWVLVDVAQEHREIGHIVDRLALEALFEQVAIAPVLSIIVIDIAAGNALDSLSHRLFSLAYEQVKMVGHGHEAVGIIGAVAATGVAIVIVPDAHTVEGIDELVVVFLVFKDILMIDASHHHMMDTCA